MSSAFDFSSSSQAPNDPYPYTPTHDRTSTLNGSSHTGYDANFTPPPPPRFSSNPASSPSDTTQNPAFVAFVDTVAQQFRVSPEHQTHLHMFARVCFVA